MKQRISAFFRHIKPLLQNITFVQISVWLGFIAAESLEEYYDCSTPMWAYVCMLPIAIGIAFLVGEKNLRQKAGILRRWVHMLAAAGIWLLESLLSGGFIMFLLEADIIPQKTHFLNGIEYLIMWLLLIAVPLLLELFGGIILGIAGIFKPKQ